MSVKYDFPKPLSDIIGAAADAANWNPIVADIAPGQGLLELGSVMSFDGTSMKLADASSYNNVFGILLERADSDIAGGACGTIARAGSFNSELGASFGWAVRKRSYVPPKTFAFGRIARLMSRKGKDSGQSLPICCSRFREILQLEREYLLGRYGRFRLL